MMWAVALQVVSRYMSLLSYSEGVPLQGSPWWSRTLALCSCVLCVLAVSYTCSKVVFPDGYSTVQLVLCTLGHASVASVHVLSLRARALLNSLCLPLRACAYLWYLHRAAGSWLLLLCCALSQLSAVSLLRFACDLMRLDPGASSLLCLLSSLPLVL